MSIKTKEPTVKAAWPPKRSDDKLFRFPMPYRVGREKGESFFTIAKKHGVKGADLVHYNFKTRNEHEINWYLANYVGCPAPKPGLQYYDFFGAAQDEKKYTGVIFIPRFGEQTPDYLNRLGEKVVENYNKSGNKEPGGRCYEACYARVRDAGKSVGAVVPALDNQSPFGRLWGSYIAPKKTWLELPEEYRGKGAAGAMAWARAGELVGSDGIWSGALEPGAVIQTWKSPGDFEDVKSGDAVVDGSYGHSFIFLNYAYSGSAISGIVIADQGYQSDEPLVKGDYAYWVGANLLAAPAP
jgi:hypothetical protein